MKTGRDWVDMVLELTEEPRAMIIIGGKRVRVGDVGQFGDVRFTAKHVVRSHNEQIVYGSNGVGWINAKSAIWKDAWTREAAEYPAFQGKAVADA